jgi:hypothetical protein
MTIGQRWLLAGGAGIILLLTAVACFYLQFTIALWPVAFGPTPTTTPTVLQRQRPPWNQPARWPLPPRPLLP